MVLVRILILFFEALLGLLVLSVILILSIAITPFTINTKEPLQNSSNEIIFKPIENNDHNLLSFQIESETNKNVLVEHNNNEVRENIYTVIGNIEFDEEKFMRDIYKSADEIILYQDPEISDSRGDDVYVELKYVNPISNFEIFYSGFAYMNEGVFWVMDNGEKHIIYESLFRYGPRIIWHGEYVAEIWQGTSRGTYSSYFDFRTKRLSSSYGNPLYFDPNNDVLFVWGDDDFELYDIRDDRLIRTYNCRRETEMRAPFDYMQRYFEKENDNTLLLFYKGQYTIGRFEIDISNPR